jgi:hypothetical protein
MQISKHVINDTWGGSLESQGEQTTMLPISVNGIRRHYGLLAQPDTTFGTIFRRAPLAFVIIEFDYRDQNGVSTHLPYRFRLDRAHLAQAMSGDSVWSRNLNQDWVLLYDPTP